MDLYVSGPLQSYACQFRAVLFPVQKFKLGIPIRDMRLLDPNLLTADIGKILVRDNAIVFAMEHIRLIISATTVIIPRDGFEQNLLNSRFNALLEESIIEAAQEKAQREARVVRLQEIAESDPEGDDASSGRPSLVHNIKDTGAMPQAAV